MLISKMVLIVIKFCVFCGKNDKFPKKLLWINHWFYFVFNLSVVLAFCLVMKCKWWIYKIYLFINFSKSFASFLFLYCLCVWTIFFLFLFIYLLTYFILFTQIFFLISLVFSHGSYWNCHLLALHAVTGENFLRLFPIVCTFVVWEKI